MTPAMTHAAGAEPGVEDASEYVTLTASDQTFGIGIERVQDVFVVASLTSVPTAPGEIVGLLNLRGRVVTAVDLRRCLGLPDRNGGGELMAIGLEHKGEAYGLVVDAVGEVLKLRQETREATPVHLNARWGQLMHGVHRLGDRLLIVLDADAVLAFDQDARAA
ncbi:chemotaxis protein CheW [Salinarimonas ramus]|uniref:Chemotaxis protein CheW n=1 Tax=Salinarimonas ramus TaxID=690164 RepID=A0A917QHN6_9HYPH|nr:chemotaxis protein CheW [Salinarimonas ramus]GGK51041.1 chemotaxis protein CheW [Salinarimonas ramus]